MRVVSLVPSVTETLLAWGVAPVACTRFCEQPGLPHVGGTKDPDVAAVVALAPHLVVMNDEENRRDDAMALTAAGLRVHVTRVASVADVPGMLRDLAAAVGVDAPTVVPPPPLPATGRSAFVPIWKRPWMTMSAATYGASVLAHLGLATVFADAATRYPEVTLDEVAARRPHLVLLPSEPYPFAARHVPLLQQAVPGARVLTVDGQDLFWWGTRTPGALARLAEALELRSTRPSG